MTQQHLFLFTIGPVQSFIAQARKTQDLHTNAKKTRACNKANPAKTGNFWKT